MKYKINRKVFYRYEPNINEGTLLLFFKDTNEIYEMSEPFYMFLIATENGFTQEQILREYEERYADLSNNEIKHNINIIENTLLDLEVLV